MDMNFLELVDMYMDQGMDEDTACRCAMWDVNPELYSECDWDEERW